MACFVTYNHTCDCCGVLIEQKTQAITKDADVSVPVLPSVLNMDLCPDCHKIASDAITEVLEPRKLAFAFQRRHS